MSRPQAPDSPRGPLKTKRLDVKGSGLGMDGGRTTLPSQVAVPAKATMADDAIRPLTLEMQPGHGSIAGSFVTLAGSIASLIAHPVSLLVLRRGMVLLRALSPQDPRCHQSCVAEEGTE